ncbi:MAG: hypothetical protein HY298_00575 [Verrucomicrobia bacterium]|nr:hypothetical protein [Verrucomicrobiota bacterium]
MKATEEEPTSAFRPLAIFGVLCLTAVAVWFFLLPYFVRDGRRNPVTSCVNNLRQLDGAMQQWGLEHKKTPGDTPRWTELVGTNLYVREMPVCPEGGSYNLGSFGGKPTCTIINHVLP